LHDFCVATDATYARLSIHLERLRGQKEDVAAYLRATGYSIGLEQVLGFLQEDIGRLEGILEGMREMIGECEDGGRCNGDGKAFLIGGRWATFL
jgi:Ni,Fe-hydrogenase III large subunit